MTRFIIVYSFDPITKKYNGDCKAWESPLEKDVFLFPANTTDISPNLEKGKESFFIEKAWINKEIEIEKEKIKTLEEVKVLKISEIKLIAANIITSTYPLYKQNNIIMSGNKDDINDMNNFILSIRQKSNKIEKQLDLLTLEELISFEIIF